MGMGMGGGGGGGRSGAAGFGLMRSFRRDESVTDYKLPPGITKRIATFARPYRRLLGLFLVLIVIDAILGAANPLIFRKIIDDGIIKKNSGLIVNLALLVALLAVLDAGLSLWQR